MGNHHTRETIDIGPWGGPGGENEIGMARWNVKQPSDNSYIAEIDISYGDVINSLSFRNGALASPIYGGEGPRNIQIIIQPTEYVTSISGTIKNDVVESLMFSSIDGTITKTHGPCGPTHPTGSTFHVPIENGEIVGFFGRETVGKHINAIGIHVIHRTPA